MKNQVKVAGSKKNLSFAYTYRCSSYSNLDSVTTLIKHVIMKLGCCTLVFATHFISLDLIQMYKNINGYIL